MDTSSDQANGYQLRFIDSIPEDFYCNKCNLVARSLTICSNCTESYCYACITDTQKQGQSCLTCGELHFQALPHVKYQKKVKELKVYCNWKERGCDWSGTLDMLDTHLDPDKDNCLYVDTKCPFHCEQTVPKNKMNQHVSEECVKRDYFCQYCSFKATYEEVVDKHLPKCVYVPLDCPNMCGVTFERDFMEDHMKICRLEEIECEFSGVGCEEKCRREDQEEHSRQNSHKHLTLTASLAKQLQQKIATQEKIIQDQEKLIKELRKDVKEEQEQKEKLKEQGNLLEQKLNSKLHELEIILKETREHVDQNKAEHDDIVRILGITRTFEMKNYSTEIRKRWMSPTMYTHVCGYKFCIKVYINAVTHNLRVRIHSVPGEFDNQLNWPAKAKFTTELIHQQGGVNAVGTAEGSWEKPAAVTYTGISFNLLYESMVCHFLTDDTLHFVSNTKIL